MNTEQHTPAPWKPSGHSDIRGADNHLIGMVNPTGGDISPKRAKADREFLIRAVNCHNDLLAALKMLREIDDAYGFDLDEPQRDKMHDAIRKAEGAVIADERGT